MQSNDYLDDFIIIMANCNSPEKGRKIFMDYLAGKVTVSRRKAEKIVREKMDKDTASEINKGDMRMAQVVPDATVDWFMSYSLLRFQSGMQRDEFKQMLESISEEISQKYFD